MLRDGNKLSKDCMRLAKGGEAKEANDSLLLLVR